MTRHSKFLDSYYQIRTDYKLKKLDDSELSVDPFQQFAKWFNDALSLKIPTVNAVTLATSSNKGKPTARIILLKGFDQRGFVFFTDYDSRKGRQLKGNPHAAMVFFWQQLERQVLVEGKVGKTSSRESDEYFAQRPRESQISACVSEQSQPIKSRVILEDHYQLFEAKHKTDSKIRRPKKWGGFRLVPQRVEFWQGRANRLHDRFSYEKGKRGWSITRLQP